MVDFVVEPCVAVDSSSCWFPVPTVLADGTTSVSSSTSSRNVSNLLSPPLQQLFVELPPNSFDCNYSLARARPPRLASFNLAGAQTPRSYRSLSRRGRHPLARAPTPARKQLRSILRSNSRMTSDSLKSKRHSLKFSDEVSTVGVDGTPEASLARYMDPLNTAAPWSKAFPPSMHSQKGVDCRVKLSDRALIDLYLPSRDDTSPLGHDSNVASKYYWARALQRGTCASLDDFSVYTRPRVLEGTLSLANGSCPINSKNRIIQNKQKHKNA